MVSSFSQQLIETWFFLGTQFRTNSWDMRDSGVPSEVLVRAVSFMIQHVGRMNLATCHADWRKHPKAALHVRMGEYFSR
jgi:hypothetical protein